MDGLIDGLVCHRFLSGNVTEYPVLDYRHRIMFLLQQWVHAFYVQDFLSDSQLQQRLTAFLQGPAKDTEFVDWSNSLLCVIEVCICQCSGVCWLVHSNMTLAMLESALQSAT
jgi:hypothetical protein